MLNSYKKIILIISSFTDDQLKDKITQHFEKSYHNLLRDNILKIIITTNASTITSTAKQFSNACENGLIIIAGGDGSLHEVVNSINFDRTNVALLPTGTGNDFARYLYNNQPLEKILENFKFGRLQTIDLLKVNNLYSINVASFGFETLVLEKSLSIKNRFNSLAKHSFSLAVLASLNKIKPVKYNYKFTLSSGETIVDQGNYIINAFCNGRHYGGGFTPAPHANIYDGKFRINQIENITLIQIAKLLSSYIDGSHIENTKISHNMEAVAAQIKAIDNSIKVNLDGEIYEFEEIDIRIVPKALKLWHIDFLE